MGLFDRFRSRASGLSHATAVSDSLASVPSAPSQRALSGAAAPTAGRADTDRAETGLAVSDRVVSDRVVSDRVVSDRVVSDRAVTDPVGRERTDRCLADRLRALVWPGFLEYAEVCQHAIELLGEDDVDLTARQILTLVDRLWDERVEQARAWPDLTDSDRFTLAFAGLEMSGILTRMNFTCCQTCGHAEIADERITSTEQGYVFFHRQDAVLLALEPARISLGFGSFVEPSPDADEAIGVSVVTALTNQGLTVDWDGTAAGSLTVRDLYFRRRLCARSLA